MDNFVKFMGNRPTKPINMTQLIEWKNKMQLLIKETYDVLKYYMNKHDLMVRKIKDVEITVAMLASPVVFFC